jgi:uncharacterized protein (TIGR02145 family)
MKKALLILAIILCSAQLFSAEPLVKFYLQDGSTKQYKISEIQNFKFINSNLTYVMQVWFRGSIGFCDTRSIDSIFFDNDKMKTAIGTNFSMINISEIDSITFIRNKCKEIQIGSQLWMCKNLNVDHYRNGDSIPEVRDSVEWINLKTGAWCYYNNDPALGEIYGKLYNWYAVNDPRGLAPEGYHVPSDSEWIQLTHYLGSDSIAGGKLKETGIIHWKKPNYGATNSSSFSALPGGCRDDSGPFGIIGYFGYWWSSTEYGTASAWSRYLGYDYAGITRSSNNKEFAFSVRCVKDK